MAEKIVVRIPPSPTGNLHIGTARTALFNYLFSRKLGGTVLLRMEDTDKERSKKEFEENIVESLKWLGMSWDGEVSRQSERIEVYQRYLEKMIEEGKAYEAEDQVIRFKNPNSKIKFTDIVRGEIEFDTSDLEDFVIAKSLTEPLYHLAVVIDDHESGVTHVIRGEDHISNTPRQILIQEAIGAKRPEYVHIPLILAPDRSKLSKRHGATAVTEYRDKGYLPEAVVNYLALLGWNPGTEQEIFTMDELIKEFSLEKIHKGGAIFDEEKLKWVNKEHVKRLPEDVQKKMKLEEARGLSYINTAPSLDPKLICWKEDSVESTKKNLEEVKSKLGDPDAIMGYAEAQGKGSVLWPMRYALSGERSSPDPFTLLEVLGKDEAERRIDHAIQVLNTEV